VIGSFVLFSSWALSLFYSSAGSLYSFYLYLFESHSQALYFLQIGPFKLQFSPKMARFSLLALALASGVYTQSTTFVDPNSGISFAGKIDPAITVGVAAPETAASDFIGQIVRNPVLFQLTVLI